MGPFLNIVQIIISIALVALILLQARGSGLGGIFGGGGDSSVYRTRRGVERTLFQLTIVVSLLFFLVSIINVVYSG